MPMLRTLAKSAQTAPISALVIFFVFWKLLLFGLATTSPGPGYDTSTSLLVSQVRTNGSAGVSFEETPAALPAIFKLARWDAIYFTSIATRGFLFEQEWAFGLGHNTHLGVVSRIVKSLSGNNDMPVVIVGVALSHIYHLLSVVVLYLLGSLFFCSKPSESSRTAFLAAALHVISPAGLFLSAPYAESLFSFLTFTGYYLHTRASLEYQWGRFQRSNMLTVLSGVIFGLTVPVRSNGLLNGLPLFYAALSSFAETIDSHADIKALSRLLALGLGGLCIAIGAFLPQYLGYITYCMQDGQRRPWCSARIPSIYTWVQSRYWNVGFLRYWTLSNVPLFLLAAPMLGMLFMSALLVLRQGLFPQSNDEKKPYSASDRTRRDISRQAALSQLLLAITTLTSSHVQIITRLASGMPLWYLWTAQQILDRENKRKNSAGGLFQTVVKWMVLYSMIQGCLYASFLPPA